MASTESSDVLIIGAGPSGCAAGIVAARAGASVCVVDRAEFPRDKVCGDAVSNDGMELLAQLGVRDSVLRGPHAPVWRSAAVFPDGTRIERSYERPGVIVRRFHLDECLRQQLLASGARVVEGCHVSALLREGGRVIGAQASSQRFVAKVVIAADGYGSVGLSVLEQTTPRGRDLAVSATGYFAGVEFPNGQDVADHYFHELLPYGYGWVFPAVEGVANVGVYLRADAYAHAGRKLDDLMNEFLGKHPERFARARRIGKLRVWSLPIAPRAIPLSAPGLLLVGDAAGLVDPLSGEGIWQALHSGMLAGATAAEAAASGELGPGARQAYERACHRAIGRPSRGKRWAQSGIEVIVARKLYRWPLVRAILTLGYRHHAMEMTKS